MEPLHYVTYHDTYGNQYTETATSPIAAVIREEELARAGYIID